MVGVFFCLFLPLSLFLVQDQESRAQKRIIKTGTSPTGTIHKEIKSLGRKKLSVLKSKILTEDLKFEIMIFFNIKAKLRND